MSRDVLEEVGNSDMLRRRVLEGFKEFGARASEWQRVPDISYVAYHAISKPLTTCLRIPYGLGEAAVWHRLDEWAIANSYQSYLLGLQ